MNRILIECRNLRDTYHEHLEVKVEAFIDAFFKATPEVKEITLNRYVDYVRSEDGEVSWQVTPDDYEDDFYPLFEYLEEIGYASFTRSAND